MTAASPEATVAPAGKFAPRKGLSAAEIEALITEFLREAKLEEKVAMMSGKGFIAGIKEDGMVWGARPYRAGGGCERLGVPPFYFTDGPRGVARGQSTCFPVTMARGAAWDRDLERRIGSVMGIEVRAQGCNLSGAVCVNLLRHPGWGRAQETYGEDPYHMGELGAALSQGIQSHNVAATVKHFALNSIENTRFKVDVQISETDLHEVYLPHFKRILDAGCATVMSAYNKMNGEYCGQSRTLLTDILRGDWGFDGFVHSDWLMGVYQTYGAAAGLDVENPEPVHFGAKLVAAVEGGQIEPHVVDTACRRILRVFYRFACADDPLPAYTTDLVASAPHRAVALEAALKSAVLLKNNGVLPLKRTGRIAVFGKLANMINTGDNGSSYVRQPGVVTALAGLRDYLGQPDLTLAGDEDDAAAAEHAAASADCAIIIAGTTAAEEGEFIPEGMGLNKSKQKSKDGAAASQHSGAAGGTGDRGGDRMQLRVPAAQAALIRAVSAANPKTVVVLVCGSAILTGEWDKKTGAILQTFYSGMQGGEALAQLIFGDVSPSGKLPFTVLQDEAHYPFFDKSATSITYGALHGYTHAEATQRTPQYAFGFGLSYSKFAYRALRVRRVADGIEAEVTVHNTGEREADEIAQLYVGFPEAVSRGRAKVLRGFERVALKPGEFRTLWFHVPDKDLTIWNAETRGWQVWPGTYRVYAGGSSRAEDLLDARVTL